MCMYICVCIYVHVYMYTCVCVCIYVYVSYTNVCVCVCVCVQVADLAANPVASWCCPSGMPRVYTYIYVRACTYICSYMYM